MWHILEKSVLVLSILVQGILQIILRTNEAYSLLPAPHSLDISASALGFALQCTTSVWYKSIFVVDYYIKYYSDTKYSGVVHNFNFKVICHKLLMGVE